MIARRGLGLGLGAVLVYGLSTACLVSALAHDAGLVVKLAYLGTVVTISQLLLVILQRRCNLANPIELLASSVWFWLVYFACVTVDGFFWHPGLAKDIPLTVPGVARYFLGLFCTLGVPMALLNLLLSGILARRRGRSTSRGNLRTGRA